SQCQTLPGSKRGIIGLCESPIRQIKYACGGIENDIQVMGFPPGRVILITQTVIQRHFLADLPLVLSISNVILQLSKTIASHPVIEGARRADISQVLN